MHKTIIVEAEQLQLKASHFKVMTVLKGHANAARQCWPSTRTIATKAALGINTVLRALAEMESLGYLTITSRGRRRSQIYTLTQRFVPASDNIATLPRQRKARASAAPAPLFDLADAAPSDSEMETLSDSVLESLSDSAAESEVLQLKDTLPNGSASPPEISSLDPFEEAVTHLRACGIAERRARSLVASWRRDHGDGPALEALAAAQRARASDPISFVFAALQAAATPTLLARPGFSNGGSHGLSRPGNARPRTFASVMFETAQRMAERKARGGGG